MSVASEWADVAGLLDVTSLADGFEPAAPPTTDPLPADMSMLMRDTGARRSLRQLLLATGIISPTTTTSATGETAVPTDVMVSQLIALPAEAYEALITDAGRITNPERISRFSEQLSALGTRTDPSDPVDVLIWVRAIGDLLRERR